MSSNETVRTGVEEILFRLKKQEITKGQAIELITSRVGGLNPSPLAPGNVPPATPPSGIAGGAIHRNGQREASATPEQGAQQKRVSSEDYEVMSFREEWESCEWSAPSLEIRRMLCFMSHQTMREDVVRGVLALHPEAKVITVEDGPGFEKRSPLEYVILQEDPSSYIRLLAGVGSDGIDVDVASYVCASAPDRSVRSFQPLVHLVQALSESNLRVPRLFLFASFESYFERCHAESWIAFARSLRHVLLETQVCVIALQGRRSPPEYIAMLAREVAQEKCESALHASTGRQVLKIRRFIPPAGISGCRRGGTYLITGGAGGLGMLLAEYLAESYAANLVLVGRSPLDESHQSKLAKLHKLGGHAIYFQADVCSLSEMRQAIGSAKKRFGSLHGVVHAAAENDEGSSVLTKDLDSFERVLRPKIEGTLILEQASEDEALDFICYFSSSSAVLGDFGSCDYAMANRFLSAYAQYVPGSARRIAIAWPLWRDGRMGFSQDGARDLYLQASGQRLLEATEGMAWFESALQCAGSMLVIAGRREPVYRFLGITEEQSSSKPSRLPEVQRLRTPEMAGWRLDQCLQWDLRTLASTILGLDQGELERVNNFVDLGFDSINLAEYARKISWRYGFDVSPSTFFSHPNLEQLGQHLLLKHRLTLEACFAELDRPAPPSEPPAQAAAQDVSPRTKTRTDAPRTGLSPVDDSQDIAIIGMSGRFAAARTVAEMWQMVVEGREGVTEIPPERFDWRASYDRQPQQPGKTDSKWMGALPGVSEFDALFFEISPRDAEQMDPRQRLLLQEGWRALEDAGYGSRQLHAERVGVFVGVEQGNYQALLPSGAGTITSNHDGILAARLSYFLDLHGPAMAVNTACSSGLVAIHQACMSIRMRECDSALVAAANLLLLPNSFIAMSQAGMLSPDGKCYAFDRRAQGIVPGEAVVAIVLKGLTAAEADGDPIYAVIRGSGVNCDGKTNGITAPNGAAQSELLAEVYQRANVNPREVGFVVAHGTGTRLGDPVEIKALHDAFVSSTSDTQFCALASNKPNFGHTFAASGLVSLTTLVQALDHEVIPPGLHCEQESDYVDWSRTAFYLNRRIIPWRKTRDRRRFGAVSAFGMSGTNAHVVVEGYDKTPPVLNHPECPCYLLAFSAKTHAALVQRVKDFLDYLQTPARPQPSFPEMSHTLLCGRQHLQHRCALVVRDRDHSMVLCRQFLGNTAQPNIYSNVVPRDFTGQKLMGAYAEDQLRRLPSLLGDYQSYHDTMALLADLYCQGYTLDWSRVSGGDQPRRIHLPAYRFDQERYWPDRNGTGKTKSNAAALGKVLHPLLHENISDIRAQRFGSWLHGAEFYLADHVVGGRKVLPAVAYLEMARAAFERSMGVEERGLELANVVWLRPLVVADDPVRVEIELYEEKQGQIRYEIYSIDPEQGERLIHGQGRAERVSGGESPRVDIASLQSLCDASHREGKQCYDEFERAGIRYGAGHRSVSKLQMGEDGSGKPFVLGELVLPASVEESAGAYLLHPGVLDGALQATVALRMAASGEKKRPGLPFAVERVKIFGRSSKRNWVWIRESEGSGDRVPKLDVDVCNAAGEVWIRLEGYSDRAVTEDRPEVTPFETASPGVLLMERVWEPTAIPAEVGQSPASEVLTLLCGMGELEQELVLEPGVTVCQMPAGQATGGLGADYGARAQRTLTLIQEQPGRAGGPLLVQLITRGDDSEGLNLGLWGLLRTAHLENPLCIPQVILVERSEPLGNLVLQLRENQRWGKAGLVRYRSGRREVAQWEELVTNHEKNEELFREGVFRPGGVYLMTGGGGGLGLLFADEVARRAPGARVLLTGRSALAPEAAKKLQQIRALGADAEYWRVDVCDRNAVEEMVAEIHNKWGAIHGIIHSAGVLQDGFLTAKTVVEVETVLRPKTIGLVNLDEVLQHEQLQFFVMFSSATGSWGNVGQGDYAAANGFMDAYAQYRTERVRAGERWGKTVSIGWPLWQEGGMKAEDSLVEQMRERLGAEPLASNLGIMAFYRVMATGRAHVAVVNGDLPRLREVFVRRASESQPSLQLTATPPAPAGDGTVIDAGAMSQAEHYFKKLLSSALLLHDDRMELNVPLDKYGLDSITSMQIVRELEKSVGPLSMTLLFEYNTIESLARHFLEIYPVPLAMLLGLPQQSPGSTDTKRAMVAPTPISFTRRLQRAPAMDAPAERSGPPRKEDIAIIGLSGRFPQARNLTELWANLKSGKDCITEIPSSRWDFRQHFDSEKGKPGKSYSKWGGFIDGVDEFDPLFFNISPREAELIDPQERLFLQCAYEVLESAGCTQEVLAPYKASAGVFVGAMYQQYRAPASDVGRSAVTSLASYGSIANRVSNFFDFRGPSIAVDTMCSSAALAIHLACQALTHGECLLAIAGGVNLSLTPAKYSGLSHLRMLGSSCDSRSLSGGDGYLPAETIGAVLLKPLSRAIADDDRILAVIKATETNHAGYSAGYSVPSLSQEAQLLQDLFRKSKIDPRSISYVEPSATGSAMGDAIECRALRKVFQNQPGGRPYCALGSVKTNVGHAEAASAMTQLSKIVLQLQHRWLVPSIFPQSSNQDLNFSDGPFALQTTSQEWKRMAVVIDDQLVELPRRALLNAFGAGGSNVSILLEEFQPPSNLAIRIPVAPQTRIFVFSAKTRTALDAQVRQMLAFIDRHHELHLHDFAWTLQVGREAMDYRTAIVAGDRREFVNKAAELLSQPQGASTTSFFQGSAEATPLLRDLLQGKTGEMIIQSVIERKDWAMVAALWVQGVNIPWRLLYQDQPATFMDLPAYPFDRERYWVLFDEQARGNPSPITTAVAGAATLSFAASDACCTVRDSLKQMVSEILMVPLDRIDTKRGLRSYGMDSLGSIRLRQRCEAIFGVRINGRDLLAHPSIERLETYVSGMLATGARLPQAPRSPEPAHLELSTNRADGPDAALLTKTALRPLSEGEKGLWLLQRLTPDMSAYNVPLCFQVRGAFHVEAFRDACDWALQRHPVLADVIVDQGGVPYRVVPQTRPPFFEQTDMVAEDVSVVQQWLRQKATIPISLSTGPMMRVVVVNRGREEAWVLIVIHHISFDAGSVWPFLSQLLADYKSIARGEPVDVKPTEARYEDFVTWEQNMLSGSVGQGHLAYFKRTLQDLPLVLELPADRVYPARPSGAGETCVFDVPQNLAAGLLHISNDLGVTLPTVFLGVYQILLSQISGSHDIVVGVSTAVRPTSQFDQLVGYFVSMMPLRRVMGESKSWDTYLRELDGDVTEALDHASYPFPTLVRNLKTKRVKGRHPVFQVAFTYQSLLSVDAVRILENSQEGIAIHFLRDLRQEGEYEIVLEVCEVENGFQCNLKYSLDIFDGSTIAHMSQHYLDLLESVVVDAKADAGSNAPESHSADAFVIHQ